jgi:hypothetical protein
MVLAAQLHAPAGKTTCFRLLCEYPNNFSCLVNTHQVV